MPLAPIASTRPLFADRYQIVARLGRGATGEVLRARDLAASGFSRDVCIKRISGELSPGDVRAMREEARLLALLRHSNVVSLFRMDHEPHGAPFLVLELVEGADLRTLTRLHMQKGSAEHAGLLPDRVAVHVACAVLRALAAVARAIPGLVHRDVTPHNVLISREGEVKLGDFGIALARDRARWTRPSVVKGKLGFMSPEQAAGTALDARCDQFAVGVVLFELLTRTRPWLDGSLASILEQRPNLDRTLAHAIDRMLAWDAGDRFPSFDSALRALAPFGAGELGSLRLSAIVHAALERPSDRAL